jgi:hypothetical protein
MKKTIHRVLLHSSISQKPPVLLDIGASGFLPEQWQWIAPYSIGIAFDADTRDFAVCESTNSGYKKLYSLNRLVADRSAAEVDFYLTRSPHCSSALPPDNQALKPWLFRSLFEVEQSIKMPAVDLRSAIASCGVDYIDWYKSDSQGTDLRIFSALPQNIVSQALVAEFEPGVIDAYRGEDKLHGLMAFMDQKPFWVSNMTVKGTQRLDQDDFDALNSLQRRGINSFLKKAPGWCEISYINTFNTESMGLREYLLGWVFSSIMGEHGFAKHLARVGGAKYSDPLFEEMLLASTRALSKGYLGLAVKAIKRAARMIVGK